MAFALLICRNYYAADTWAAVWIALMTCGTMFPMSVYSGKILLQVTLVVQSVQEIFKVLTSNC